MSSNDTLLMKMIDSDMKLKGVDCYHLTDVVELDPETIKVKANEAVYIHHFMAQPEGGFGFPSPFYVKLLSANDVIEYDSITTIAGASTRISKHYENIHITGFPFPYAYLIHYVRVKF